MKLVRYYTVLKVLPKTVALFRLGSNEIKYKSTVLSYLIANSTNLIVFLNVDIIGIIK